MKRKMKMMMAALLAVMMMTAPIAALADNDEGAPAEAEVRVEEKQEEKAEAPKAEEKKEEKAEAPKAEEKKEEKAEAPKAEEKQEEKAEAPRAEEKQEEKAEAPSDEAPVIETLESDLVMIEEYRALGSVFSNEIEPEEAPAQDAADEAADEAAQDGEADAAQDGEPAEDEADAAEALPETEGDIRVDRDSSGFLKLGDEIALRATVSGVEGDYEIRWESTLDGNWEEIGTGETLTFTLDEDNAIRNYRAVLVTRDPAAEKASEPYALTGIEAWEVKEEGAEGDEAGAGTEGAEGGQGDGGAAGEADSGMVTLVDTDVRFDANGMSPIFYTLPAGTRLSVLGIEGDWVKIEVNGQIGYIHVADVRDITETVEVEEQDGVYAIVTEKRVTIFSSRRHVMAEGDSVQLTSRLEGFEDCSSISFQWECDQGAGFRPVAGAINPSYIFAANAESLSWSWRLTVDFE